MPNLGIEHNIQWKRIDSQKMLLFSLALTEFGILI